jgi:Icc-related predicted phosphoesterase
VRLIGRKRTFDARSSDGELTIYFASDLHGSTLCWKKFLATPSFYGADVIIVGGDVTGKFLVPIVSQGDGTWLARYQGSDRVLTDLPAVEALEQMAEDAGAYAVRLTADEMSELHESASARDDLLTRCQFARLEHWGALADERLDAKGVRCFVSGGNDDDPAIDALLDAHPAIEVPEGRVVEPGGGLQMISLGFANETPWHCPRDVPESELAARLDALASSVEEPGCCIFNVHVPPYDTGLDMAPALDETLTPRRSPSGDLVMAPVGSTAVRAAIERHQPLLGLHGHIHEAQGIHRLGSTVVCNPGSEYQEGVLHGILLKWDPRAQTLKHQLVIG